MLYIADVFIDLVLTFGDLFWLTGVRPYYPKGGDRSTIEGYMYTVVLAERQFNKVNVKIPGKLLLQAPPEGAAVEVAFDGLNAQHYVIDGKYVLSITAKGIKQLQK